jgi:FkbM family methyltransferase
MNAVLTRYGKMRIIGADNVISRALALYGEWAMDELTLLSQIITPSMCVLDIGAFIGTHTLALSEFVGSNGKVYAFEPRKEIYEILLENTITNNCHNVTALNIGLAEKEQVLHLQTIDISQTINFGGLALNASGNPLSLDTNPVHILTIDSLDIKKIDVIKIDVEGMERKVLDGAINAILNSRPIILCECNDLKSGNEVLDFCHTTKYDTYGILTSAFNHDNFNANKDNIFGAAKELELLLIPHEKSLETLVRLANINLFPIVDIEDLVLPLLNKPQYPSEVLVHTAPYSMLGINFPSPSLTKRDSQISNLNQAVVERDSQISNLNQAVVERDSQISNLNQAVVERDSQISNLNQAVVERDSQISNLNQVVVERDSQISNLNQVVVERDSQISNLNQAVVEQSRSYENILAARDLTIALSQQQKNQLQALCNELQDETRAYRLSTSWRITKPLRQISQLRSQFRRIIKIYQNYRKINPGTGGFIRLTHKCVDALKKGGIRELRNATTTHERIRSNELQKKILPDNNVLLLNEVDIQNFVPPTDVAVHAHVFYPNMALEMQGYLANIPVNFNLYVTTDTSQKAKEIKLIFSALQNIKKINISITENRGRDISPMLVTLGAKLAKHELVLHIHTKRSPHDVGALGGWRRYLMESLLGNSQRVSAIFQQFINDKNLGILFPAAYHPTKPFIYTPEMYNQHHMEKLLIRSGKEKETINNIDGTFFPSGCMFWFRGNAIQSFIKMKLSTKDFEPEEGQLNQTLAHAIERMFPYFASEQGLLTKSYLASSFLSTDCSAHNLDLLQEFQSKGLITYPTILFDHNGGGGTNIFTSELIKNINTDGHSVLRVYPFSAGWIIQWFGKDDGMLFHTTSIEEVFKVLSSSRSTNIIINSLYGHPNVRVSASNIVDLVFGLSAKLDIKIHDFNALCVSPHLLDVNGTYCGVPKDFNVCRNCLKKNNGWYHSWIPEDHKAVDIIEWRKPFAKLFEAATTITFFDPSSIEIVRQAFNLEKNKIKIIPHTTNYFKCDVRINLGGPMQIGVLGTLSKGKGGDVVKALYEYIESKGIYADIPITLVGSSFVELPRYFPVHGTYKPDDLPAIINKRGINVILMPSIVPETFSYTISEAIKMGLPIVAFDIGAQGNRVKQYELGKVVPLGSSPEVILEAIKTILKTAQELNK